MCSANRGTVPKGHRDVRYSALAIQILKSAAMEGNPYLFPFKGFTILMKGLSGLIAMGKGWSLQSTVA